MFCKLFLKCLLAAAVLISLAVIAQPADVFKMPTGLTNLEFVTVGDPGNGGVNDTYDIGKYEVTAGQYTEFLNAVAATDTYGLYNIKMSDPINSYGCNIQRVVSWRRLVLGVR